MYTPTAMIIINNIRSCVVCVSPRKIFYPILLLLVYSIIYCTSHRRAYSSIWHFRIIYFITFVFETNQNFRCINFLSRKIPPPRISKLFIYIIYVYDGMPSQRGGRRRRRFSSSKVTQSVLLKMKNRTFGR